MLRDAQGLNFETLPQHWPTFGQIHLSELRTMLKHFALELQPLPKAGTPDTPVPTFKGPLLVFQLSKLSQSRDGDHGDLPWTVSSNGKGYGKQQTLLERGLCHCFPTKGAGKAFSEAPTMLRA